MNSNNPYLHSFQFHRMTGIPICALTLTLVFLVEGSGMHFSRAIGWDEENLPGITIRSLHWSPVNDPVWGHDVGYEDSLCIWKTVSQNLKRQSDRSRIFLILEVEGALARCYPFLASLRATAFSERHQLRNLRDGWSWTKLLFLVLFSTASILVKILLLET